MSVLSQNGQCTECIGALRAARVSFVVPMLAMIWSQCAIDVVGRVVSIGGCRWLGFVVDKQAY